MGSRLKRLTVCVPVFFSALVAPLAAAPEAPEYVVFDGLSADLEPRLESAFADPLDLRLPDEQALDTFLERQPQLLERLALRRSDLVISAVFHRELDHWIVASGEEHHQGIRVQGAPVQLLFESTSGRLLKVAFVDLSGWAFNAATPRLSALEAVEAATARLGTVTLQEEPALHFVLPGEGAIYRLAWEVRATGTRDPDDPRRLFIDAAEGTLLADESTRLDFDATGTVEGFSTPLGSLLPDYPGNPPVLQLVPALKVTGTPGSLEGFTDANGFFSIPTGSSSVTLTATPNLGTSICGNTDSPMATDQATGLTGIELVLNDSPSDPNRKRFTSQLNAWQYVMKTRQFLDAIYARTQVPFVPGIFKACDFNPPQHKRYFVNLQTGVTPAFCEAQFAGYIPGCPSTIRLDLESPETHGAAHSTIIYHEFGHHFAWEITSRSPSSHELIHGEALADVVSALVSSSPKLGEGGRKGEESTYYDRDLEAGKANVYFCDPTLFESGFYLHPVILGLHPTPQKRGMPYSGAWWDLRKKLIQNYANGQEIAEDLLVKYYDTKFLTILPALSHAFASEILAIDDSPYFGGNNCLQDGTPHQAEIVDAFVKRNLYLKKFKRGDANASGSVDISDPVFIRNWYFFGGPTPPCLDAADANDDGRVDNSDQIFLYNWLFGSCSSPPCPAPPAPGPFTCGTDAATWADRLTCITYSPCEVPPVPCPP